MYGRISKGVSRSLGVAAGGLILTVGPRVQAATVYYSCGYTIESADGSKEISGCTKGAVEGPSPKGMLDRCMGKTKEKDGLVDNLDCCATAKAKNPELVAKHAKTTVNVTMISGKQEDGPSGVCK